MADGGLFPDALGVPDTAERLPAVQRPPDLRRRAGPKTRRRMPGWRPVQVDSRSLERMPANRVGRLGGTGATGPRGNRTGDRPGDAIALSW